MRFVQRLKSFAGVSLAVAALAGCNLDLIEYRDRLQDEQRMVERIDAYSPTAFAAMPTVGQASFQGYSNLYIDRVRDAQGDGIFAVGDAVVTADFENGELTGVVDNFVGVTNVRLDSSNAVVTDDINAIDVSGQIILGSNESHIGNDAGTKTSRPNDWFMDYEGNLIIGDDTYVLDGEIDGQFYGTRVDNPNTDFPIKALAGGEELYSGSTATIEGTDTVYDSNLVIVAEN